MMIIVVVMMIIIGQQNTGSGLHLSNERCTEYRISGSTRHSRFANFRLLWQSKIPFGSRCETETQKIYPTGFKSVRAHRGQVAGETRLVQLIVVILQRTEIPLSRVLNQHKSP